MIAEIKGIDIYLLDQIMKGNFKSGDKILDAGCGNGRNMHWFIKNGFDISGIDPQSKDIQSLKERYPNLKEQFTISDIESSPLKNGSFDYIICNAVLHFAKSTTHFHQIFQKLVDLCKPNGTIFIRITSDIGIEDKVIEIEDGVYKIPDGSIRFLLTASLLDTIKSDYSVKLSEPLKTVNVDGIRCMSTLVFEKLSF